MDARTDHAHDPEMLIDWDVPIPMDDGVVLRADVFRPAGDARYPVILTLRPVREGARVPGRLSGAVEAHGRAASRTCRRARRTAYQNWEAVDPEKWVPDGYACVRVDSRGAGRSPGFLDPWSPRETDDLYECIEWAGAQPWSERQGRPERHLLLRDEPVAGRGARSRRIWRRSASWEGAADFYRDATHHGGILLHVLGATGTTCR